MKGFQCLERPFEGFPGVLILILATSGAFMAPNIFNYLPRSCKFVHPPPLPASTTSTLHATCTSVRTGSRSVLQLAADLRNPETDGDPPTARVIIISRLRSRIVTGIHHTAQKKDSRSQHHLYSSSPDALTPPHAQGRCLM